MMDHNYLNLFRKKMINNYCQKYMMCRVFHITCKFETYVFFINGFIVWNEVSVIILLKEYLVFAF